MSEAQPNLRARVACKTCNARRVRCDRSASGRACSNCRQAGTLCELIESKRGKHKRLRSKKHHTETASETSEATTIAVQSTELPPGSLSPERTDTGLQRQQASPQTRPTRRYVSPSLPDFVIHKEPSDGNLPGGGGGGGKVVYMGDSGNMKYVIHEVGDPFKNSTAQHKLWGDNLQRYMVDQLGPRTQAALRAMRLEDEQHLRGLGALQPPPLLPERRVSDEMVAVFFGVSYPAFPVFNRADFMGLYEAQRLSPLVLNAVYFMACIHCPEPLLRSLGFTSRYLACLTYYRRAKALSDADYDSDGIATVQALVLMLNWWGGPMDQKDTWHWLGCAANLAQGLGMHRTKSYSSLPPSHQRLWRRIWWVLYINDIHYAAVYGRPPHIHRDFCDITPLTKDDFVDCGYDAELGAETAEESKLYMVHLADLACRVGNCLFAKFSAVQDPATEQRRYHELVDFEKTLPPSFTRPASSASASASATASALTPAPGFWPSLVQLYHCDYQIIFHRMLSDGAADASSSSSSSPDSDGATFVAAGRISRILEDLLASGTLYQAPFMVLPAIFASILVHIIHIRKGSAHMQVVAEHRARLAMHILDRFQDAWPLAIWTRHLLDCLLKGSSSSSSSAGPGGARAANELAEQQQQQQQQQPGGSQPFPGHRAYPADDQAGNRIWAQSFSQVDVGGGRLEITTPATTNDDTSPADHQQHMDSFQLDQYPGFNDPNFGPMPLIFPLNNMLEDAGLSPDSWLFDYNNMQPYL